MLRIASAILAAVGLLFSAVAAVPVAAASSGSLAAGSFTLNRDDGSHRIFSFALLDGRRGTTGQALWILYDGTVVHIHINCFTRVGNQAIVGGTSDSAEFRNVAWAIQDNPDNIGLVAYSSDGDSPNITCDNLLQLDNEPDISGELHDWGTPLHQGSVVMLGAG